MAKQYILPVRAGEQRMNVIDDEYRALQTDHRQ
jgi:hypothetical protein